MNHALQIFSYNGSNITFKKGDATMIDATEMAKPFGKRCVKWLEQKSTISFIESLSKVRQKDYETLIQTQRGGVDPKTWFHEDVALEFARWLSPEFAIWCNDRIKELLTTGKTEIKPLTPAEALLQNVQLLVEQERRLSVVESKLDTIEAKLTTSPIEYFAVSGYARLQNIKVDTGMAKKLGKYAASICKDLGYVIGKVPDAKYGSVNTYPAEVLGLVFDEHFKKAA